MADTFPYDVFLSHSSKDKSIVRDVAERLRADGIKVWFDEWVLKPGDSIPAKIDEGLDHSRVLVLCMSVNAFGSDWAQLEASTFRFRDPLNKGRSFVPLRLDDTPIKGSLAQFLYIDWLPSAREREYTRLLEACSPPDKWLQRVNVAPLRNPAKANSLSSEYGDVPAQWLERHLKSVVEAFSSSPTSTAYLQRRAWIMPDRLEIEAVENWLTNRCSDPKGTRLTVVLGEYGYGKTSLCLRVASAQADCLLASGLGNVPLYLSPTSKICEQGSGTYAERLAPFVCPAIPASTLTKILQSGHGSLFIDGLDEILGTLVLSERIHLVTSLIETPLQQGNCVVLTCRTHVFESLGEAQSLIAGLEIVDHRMTDRTASVVEQLLQNLESPRDARCSEAKVLMLERLSEENVDDFMRRTNCTREWELTRSVPGVVDLAKRPVLLYLIGKITASLRDNQSEVTRIDKNLSVSALYELAIKTWIRRDSACGKLQEKPVFDLLEAKAMEFWNTAFRIRTILGNRSALSPYMHRWRNTIERSKDMVPLLERAGLLVKDTSRDEIPFPHYSFLEFFLARAVTTQICSLDASILALLNLVAMYTVNQFLVEQILSASLAGEQRNYHNLPRKIIGNAEIMTRPVSSTEFIAFLRSSGWREGGLLWGSSRSHAGRSGVKPLDGMELEDFEWGTPGKAGEQPVSNISWYDACVFAKYFGGRLCSPDELKSARISSAGIPWEWTSKWRDHGRSLMTVHARDDRIGGANPDVRDSSIGFRVAWP